MKYVFVLDENVLYLLTEDTDSEARALFEKIAVNCHKIAIEYSSVLPQYYRQLQRLAPPHQPQRKLASRLFHDLLRNLDKTWFAEELAPLLVRPECLKNDDVPLVRLAASAHGILVSIDEPLLDCLLESSLPTQFAFQACSPTQALPLASQTDP